MLLLTLPNTSNKHKHTFKYTIYTNDIQIYIAASHRIASYYNEFKFTENENVHVIYAWISLEFFVLASIRFSHSPNTIFGFSITLFSLPPSFFTSLPFHFAIKLFDRYFAWCTTAIVIESFWLKTHTQALSPTRTHTHLLLSFRFLQSCRWIFFLIVIINRSSSSSSSFEMEGRKSCHMHDKRIRQITLKYKRQMNEKSWMYLSRRKKKIENECVRACERVSVCTNFYTSITLAPESGKNSSINELIWFYFLFACDWFPINLTRTGNAAFIHKLVTEHCQSSAHSVHTNFPHFFSLHRAHLSAKLT